MNTDTIVPIAVITATPADKFFDPVEPDGVVVALAEVLTVVLGVALLPAAVLVVMFVMALFDVAADDSLIDDAGFPVDAEVAGLGVALTADCVTLTGMSLATQSPAAPLAG